MQENSGFVKVFRSLKNWQWYTNVNVKVLFIHLLLSASYKDFAWQGQNLKAGQLVTGRKKLAAETGLTEWQVLRALEKLKSTKDISTRATSKYTIITVNKWLDYQVFCKSDAKPHLDNRTSNTQQQHNRCTQYKNINNKENIKNKNKDSFSNSAYPNVLNLADLYRDSLENL